MRRMAALVLVGIAACSKPAPSGGNGAELQPSAIPVVSAAPPPVDSTLPVLPETAGPQTPEDVRFLADMHLFCDTIRDVKADPKVKKPDQALEIVKRLAKSVKEKKASPAFLEFLAGLQSAGTGSTKYQKLVDEAEKRGEPGFRCPEMADDF